jgi:hypothetical protein
MTRHERKYSNPTTLETATLACQIRGEQNYVVAVYRGAEDGGATPCCLQRGGVDFARQTWARFHRWLIGMGFIETH